MVFELSISHLARALAPIIMNSPQCLKKFMAISLLFLYGSCVLFQYYLEKDLSLSVTSIHTPFRAASGIFV
jgi:hypothetical protein